MIFPNTKICLWAPCACYTALQPTVKCMTGLISKTFRKDFFPPSQCIREVKISQFLSEPEPMLTTVILPPDGGVFPELLVQGIPSSLALCCATTSSFVFFQGFNVCVKDKSKSNNYHLHIHSHFSPTFPFFSLFSISDFSESFVRLCL